MQIQDLLRPELIKLPLDAEKKFESISELVDLLVQYHEVPMSRRHAIIDELRANEWSIGTGLERGIAFPHISTDRVDDFICALGIAPAGINFASLDDKPARVILLALAPKKALSQEIGILAEVEAILDQDDILGKLTRAKTREEAYEILCSVEALV